MTPAQLSIIFFLQLAVIIIACRGVGWLAKRYLGQPQVVGEMIAGVILGPSLLGLLAPDIQALLFPKDSRSVLFVGAQFGVGLYMFLVGLGFRGDHFKANVGSAAAVSLSGMAAPFLLAILITPWLMSHGLFNEKLTLAQTTLFMGACIAITAFPMLARIIHERGLSGTPLGTLSLSAGAIDDAGAWTVLAIVLATFGDGPMVAVKAIGGGLAFAVFMLTLGPRLLAPLGRKAEREGKVSQTTLGIVLILFLLSAWAMDAAGIHAVFGGFLLGCVMPRGVLSTELRRQLEPFAVVVLLPMFFTYSGLHTQLTLVDSMDLVLVTLGILVASILAKGVACWAAARLTGQDNATAMGIGALMNARGLMELIIINIGLQKGIIGPALFSMLVLMAIITTLMASPLFELVYGRKARARGELGELNEQDSDFVEARQPR
jgi:Kef-type K+ transport system membrane component KefB